MALIILMSIKIVYNLASLSTVKWNFDLYVIYFTIISFN